MDRYFTDCHIPSGMVSGARFLIIRLRAFAHHTEVEGRVLKAMTFASGTEDVAVTRTQGHFGNPIIVLDAELKKAGDMKRFLNRVRDTVILKGLAGQEDRRTDDDCIFHLRLDKQKAYQGELALATGRDVIDVRIKVGVYPARRGDAVRAVADWISAADAAGPDNG